MDLHPATDGRSDGESDAEVLELPLFPGYFFIQWADSDAEPAMVDRTLGCGRLVRAPGADLHAHPIALPSSVIEWIQTRLASPYYSGFTLGAKEAASQSPIPLPGLETALDQLLSPPARVAALLQAIGAEQSSEDDEPLVKRPRRTRGHGRKIHY